MSLTLVVLTSIAVPVVLLLALGGAFNDHERRTQ